MKLKVENIWKDNTATWWENLSWNRKQKKKQNVFDCKNFLWILLSFLIFFFQFKIFKDLIRHFKDSRKTLIISFILPFHKIDFLRYRNMKIDLFDFRPFWDFCSSQLLKQIYYSNLSRDNLQSLQVLGWNVGVVLKTK